MKTDKITRAEAKLAGVCVMCGVVPPEPDWRDILQDEWHQYCNACFWKSCKETGKKLSDNTIPRLLKPENETKKKYSG